MTRIREQNLDFTFDSGVAAEAYDKWVHTSRLQNMKALDIVAVEDHITPKATWLIEVKDLRVITQPPKPANLAGLPATVAQKVMDSLNGLVDAAAKATNANERQHAVLSLVPRNRRVVLHLEPPPKPHPLLFPGHYLAPNVLMKLRQLVHHVDPQPLVVNIATTPSHGVPWQVS